ncbi:MAG TPA: c-type cytochrome, partial [Balneolaceae bacterium]|nr:c-type cytochrome [Balneolaceae bacterium]
MGNSRITSYGPILLMMGVFLGAAVKQSSVPQFRTSGFLTVVDTTFNKFARGEELYLKACAACHGVKGRGLTQSQLGFALLLPDLSDCNFATREPNADWIAIAHQGGPVRGFSSIMPAFGGLLSKDDIEKVIEHIRTFCTDASWPRGDLNLPRALVTEKAFPEDEAVLSSSVN